MTWSLLGAYPPEDYSSAEVFRAYAAGLPSVTQHLGVFPRETRDLLERVESVTPHAQRLGRSPCIVTGQQPHWIGGPAFVLYKAATCISLARTLSRAQGEEIDSIFWSHSDDSDTSEVDHVRVVNFRGDLQRFSLGMPPSRKPLFEQIPSDGARDVYASFCEALVPGPEPHPVLEEFAASAGDGAASVADLFRAWMRRVYTEDELAWVEPRELRTYAREIAAQTVDHIEEFLARWIAVDQTLDGEGLARPFDPRTAPLFFFFLNDARERVPVRVGDDARRWSVGDSSVDVDTLRRRIDDAGEILPGTLLRVVLQSAALPVVAYIGGHAEIAYQIYALPLFELFQLARPVLLPRLSLTVLEPSHVRLIERFGIEHLIRFDLDDLKKRVPREKDPVIEERLAHLESVLDDDLEAVRERVAAIDTSLLKSIETTRNALRSQVNKARQRVQKVLQNRSGTGTRQATKLAHWIRPGGGLQERALSGLQMMHRYGRGLPRDLIERADPFTDTHRCFLATDL